MTLKTFDRAIRSIHFAHEIVPGSPMSQQVERAQGACEQPIEILYMVEGGYIVQAATEAVFIGDDGEFVLTDIIEGSAVAKRDYRREYDGYHKKPAQKKNRAMRNAARTSKGLEVGDKREVDHKVPLSKGGDNEPENLRVVSRDTNRSKGDSDEGVEEAGKFVVGVQHVIRPGSLEGRKPVIEYRPDRRYGVFNTRVEAKAAWARDNNPELDAASDAFAAKHFDQNARNLKHVKILREDELDETISRAALGSLERALDKLFAAAKIDVEFTKHFMDRVNDPRNGKDITVEELAGLFRETWKKYRKTLEKAKPNWTAILQDVATEINIPIVMDVNQYGELELVAKTIMRKKDFTGRAKRLRVKSESTVKEDDLDEFVFGVPTKLLPLRGVIYRMLNAPGMYRKGKWTIKRVRDYIKDELIVRFIPTDKEIASLLNHYGLVKTGAEFVYETDEGVNDKYILKAVFMTGGAGAGKSFIADLMLGGTGLKVVNSDTNLERAMAKAGLDLKRDMSSDAVQREGGLRDVAKRVTTGQMDLYVKGRLGLVIDSTAAKVGKVEKQVKALRALGYDCAMVFVNTSLETSLARNQERARTVPEPVVKKDWALVQDNLKKYRSLFGPRNFREVINDEVLSPQQIAARLMPELVRMAMPLLNAPVKNPLGKKWIADETKRRAFAHGGGMLAASHAADQHLLTEDMDITKIECLYVDEMADALQTAIRQNPEDVHLVAEHFGPFEAAVAAGEFERAELLYEAIVRALPLDELTERSMHARLSQVRNTRRGTTKEIQSGSKNKGQVRAENRKRRIAGRSKHKMTSSRVKRTPSRSLSVANESGHCVQDLLDEAGTGVPPIKQWTREGKDYTWTTKFGEYRLRAMKGSRWEISITPNGSARSLNMQHGSKSVMIGFVYSTGSGAAEAKGHDAWMSESVDEATRISTKDPMTMTAGQINKELDKLDAASSKLTTSFIEAGRGSERFSEIAKAKDPLALEMMAVTNRESALRDEGKARYGPKLIGKLPTHKRGAYGPRKRNESLEEASKASLKGKIMSMVSAIDTQKRSGNVRKEQAAHEKLMAFTEKHGIDFANALEGGRKALNKKNPISRKMSGFESLDEARKKKPSDKLRDMDDPKALGYSLDRKTLMPKRTRIDMRSGKDHGADPLGNGKFKMVPSGDVVDYAERTRRLKESLDEGSRNFWFSTATNERYKMILSDDGKVKFVDHQSKTMPSTFFMHEVNGAPFKIPRINAWAKSLVGKTRVEVVREMLLFVDVAKTVESLEEASLPTQAYGVMRGKELLYLTNRSRAAFSWLEQTAMGDRSGRGGSDLQVVKNPQGWKRRWAQMGELLPESFDDEFEALLDEGMDMRDLGSAAFHRKGAGKRHADRTFLKDLARENLSAADSESAMSSFTDGWERAARREKAIVPIIKMLDKTLTRTSSVSHRKGRTLMVINAEPDAQRAKRAVELLRRQGFDVTTKADGERTRIIASKSESIDEDMNSHGMAFTPRQLLSMWEDEDEATRGTFEDWRGRYFSPQLEEALQAEVDESQQRHAAVYKARGGKWFLELAAREYGEQEDADVYGPFLSEKAANDYLRNGHFSNPGGLFTDKSGKRPVPKKAPNGRPVIKPQGGGNQFGGGGVRFESLDEMEVTYAPDGGISVRQTSEASVGIVLTVERSKRSSDPAFRMQISGSVGKIQIRGEVRPVYMGLEAGREITTRHAEQVTTVNRADDSGRPISYGARAKVLKAVHAKLLELQLASESSLASK